MIEVEVRGRIKNFEKVLNDFRKKAKFVEEKDRFSMVYFRTGSPINREAVKSEKVDFKLRITNKKPEIVMKYGLVKGSESRKEILIPIKLEDFDEAVELFRLIGWEKGVIMATKTFVFMYKGIEFALVHNKKLEYFEAEKLVEKDENTEEVISEIRKVCGDFGLEFFSEDEFFRVLDSINQEKELQFNLTEQDFSDVKKKFKEFF